MNQVVFRLLGASLGLMLISSCQPNAERKAYQAFNEGVALSLDAAKLTDTAQARSLERRAVLKYQEALQLDSTHRLARSAMGHSYYLLDNYPQAIRWFEAHNRLDSTSAPNYRELGLSRISLGQIEPGWADLQRAFRLDASAEIRQVTADDLFNLGQRAYQYGENYAATGEAARGQAYKQYAVGVLQMAYATDRSRKDIAQTLARLAAQAAQPNPGPR